MSFLSSIPSPSSGTLDIGPLSIHAYGLMIALGVVAAVWLAVVALTRISSLGGMTAALAGPLAAWFLGRGDLAIALAGIALVVLWRHRANIARLRAGTEPRIGQKG